MSLENIKIKSCSEEKANEIILLAKILGYERLYNNFTLVNGWVCLDSDDDELNVLCVAEYQADNSLDKYKEITIEQLRDMVVLKRNDRKDANVIQDGDIPCLYDLYLTDNKELYFYHCGKEKWILSNLNGDQDYYNLLKPIKKEKTVKEYLDPDNEYALIMADDDTKSDQWIEIPDGAETFNFYSYKDNSFFLKKIDGNTLFFSKGNPFGWQAWGDSDFDGVVCLWKRNKEEAGDLMQASGVGIGGVDATLAERESQYGSFSDVAELTCDLMGDLIRPDMSFVQREALHMICSKLARIRCGDINYKDNWHDIAGYATLVVQDLEKKSIDSANINKTDNRDWVEEIESSKD